jgi:hypothetical protein
MKRIAIFTEGLSEFVFTRHLVPLLFGYENVSFECLRLHAGNLQYTSFKYTCPNPQSHFLIVNAGSDESVVTAIKDRELGLFAAGYDHIIGLRDVYSAEYRLFSQFIDDAVIVRFIEAKNQVIQNMSDPSRIQVHFAIMEFESWLLAMYNLFPKIDPRLTSDTLRSALGVELRAISPERTFFHPSVQVGQIFGLVGRAYTKSEDDITSIVSSIDEANLLEAEENGRCPSLENYVTKIESFRQSPE